MGSYKVQYTMFCNVLVKFVVFNEKMIYVLNDIEQAKPQTLEKVCEIVKKQLALSPETAVTGESKFAALGADSLDTVCGIYY